MMGPSHTAFEWISTIPATQNLPITLGSGSIKILDQKNMVWDAGTRFKPMTVEESTTILNSTFPVSYEAVHDRLFN